MEKNEQEKPPLISFLAVAVVPFVAFALANVLFLPFALAIVDFPNSFLANLIPSNIPGSGYLIFAVFALVLFIMAMVVLVSPALTSLIANLIVPISTNMPRAILSGAVFFFFHSILVVILIVLRISVLTPTPVNYPFPSPTIGPLIILEFLAGVVLSCSVILFGWLGAQIRKKRT